MTGDVERFRDEIVAMVTTLAGGAALEGLEPGIKLTVRMRGRGHVEGVVDINPDHLNQQHRFNVEANQSYLRALILSCDAILASFPVISTTTQ
ncbi:hypothetical protein QE361_002772 [Sphingomonas sp. SORGH_AS802]|nr:hypothetical protein [Sphingomonas sp. SORGH_AS_0802]